MKKNKSIETYISRRAFFARFSRVLFVAVGVPIAGQLFSFLPRAEASAACRSDAGEGKYCGQFGWDCKSCSATLKDGSSWWSCCENPAATAPGHNSACPVGKWMKCTYKDKCVSGTVDSNCRGTRRTAGSSESDWCSGFGNYVCTETSCAGQYGTKSDCNSA